VLDDSKIILSFPDEKGNIKSYKTAEASVMSNELQKKSANRTKPFQNERFFFAISSYKSNVQDLETYHLCRC